MVAPAPVAAPAGPTGAGATVYVPVYSSIYIREGNQTFDLTVTLSVRNTDAKEPITIHGLRFYDRDGKLIHTYVETPMTVGPLASTETLVAESDTRAGVGGSFVVDWGAHAPVPDPVIEAVMIGSGNGQGISFLSPGRVTARHGAP